VLAPTFAEPRGGSQGIRDPFFLLSLFKRRLVAPIPRDSKSVNGFPGFAPMSFSSTLGFFCGLPPYLSSGSICRLLCVLPSTIRIKSDCFSGLCSFPPSSPEDAFLVDVSSPSLLPSCLFCHLTESETSHPVFPPLSMPYAL